ncbi:L,D-transpeptidase [Bifidobacterium vespertilionis]|uniref:L,D-transpeptidase n=1 Tax=Bifidobacterium vespertilionis TaxID=2562524 RepID=UPI001BDD31CE|nr:L,D-transpeptidase [Bifidobacterium vespertilionis]MBT1178430.1 L,D-transpeptidase family protein [Bifidobacterium vespertilionis]
MANAINEGFDPERTAYIPPLPAPETLTMPGSGPARGHDHTRGAAHLAHKRHTGLIVALCVLAAVLVIAVGGFFGARSYFADRVAPGVTFAGESLAGKSADEARAVVESKAADSRIAVSAQDGKTFTASLDDLGVSVDVDATVANLVAAKAGGSVADDLSRINPWSAQDVPLVVSTDKLALSNALTAQFIDESERAVASTVSYGPETKNFAVTPGKEGQSPVSKSVEDAVVQAAAHPGTTVNASVTYETVAMPITVQTAQKAADDANARLNVKLVVNNGAKKSFTVPAEEVAKWIGFDEDPDAGTIALKYDDKAAESYLNQVLPNELKQDMVKASVVTNKAGKVMITLQEGVDGVTVANTDDAVSQVVNALHSGSDVTATVKTDVTKFETDSRVVDYESPNGDPHVVVNLSEQKVYAYKGSTLVNTFLTSTGKLSTPTDNGTFFVYIKYEKKTMRGADYVTPNVPWSIFYNQGEALHGAPWNPDGIAKGEPRSHGCVNMNVADAKWMYDFLPVGAMVQVVGTTPTAAVRAPAPDPAAADPAAAAPVA